MVLQVVKFMFCIYFIHNYTIHRPRKFLTQLLTIHVQKKRWKLWKSSYRNELAFYKLNIFKIHARFSSNGYYMRINYCNSGNIVGTDGFIILLFNIINSNQRYKCHGSITAWENNLQTRGSLRDVISTLLQYRRIFKSYGAGLKGFMFSSTHKHLSNKSPCLNHINF